MMKTKIALGAVLLALAVAPAGASKKNDKHGKAKTSAPTQKKSAAAGKGGKAGNGARTRPPTT